MPRIAKQTIPLMDEFHTTEPQIVCTISHPDMRWFLDARYVQQVYRVGNHGVAWLDPNAGQGMVAGHHLHTGGMLEWLDSWYTIYADGRKFTFKPLGEKFKFERPDWFMDREEGRRFLAGTLRVDQGQLF